MRIAFIGLGAMGGPMARRLAGDDDIEVAFFDTSVQQLAAVDGLGQVAESVADAMSDADAVFTVLPADAHVRSVAEEVRKAGRAGQVFVDFSTVSPDTITDVAADLADVGMETVSVSLTRSTAAAQRGELALFVGGVAAVPDDLGQAFARMATDVVLVGGLGAAKAVKLANNMIVSCLDIAICEAIVLGGRTGAAPKQVTDALAAAGADSWALENHIVRYVLPDDLGPGRFSTRYMAKDVGLFQVMADRAGTPAMIAGVASAYYRGVIGQGMGDDYHMIVVRWLERGAGAGAGGSGRAPVLEETAAAMAAIPAAVQAIQYAVSADALAAAAAHGRDLSDAASDFGRGSAGNAALRTMVRGGGGEVPTLGRLISDLDGLLAVAGRIAVPAVMFEVARQLLAQAAAIYGPDTAFLDVPWWEAPHGS